MDNPPYNNRSAKKHKAMTMKTAPAIKSMVSTKRPVRAAKERAARILSDTQKLLVEDPSWFADVVQQLWAQAAKQTGKAHPLASVAGSNAQDPFLRDLVLPAGVFVSETQ